MANNLIVELKTTFGFSVDEIQHGLNNRTPGHTITTKDIEDWLAALPNIPSWAQKAAALWIVELWMYERDGCHAGALLAVDKKYTRLLHGFSLEEIIAMRTQIEH